MAKPKLTEFKVEINWDTKALEEAFANLNASVGASAEALGKSFGSSNAALTSNTLLSQPVLPGMEYYAPTDDGKAWLAAHPRLQRKRRKPKPKAPEHNHVTARRKMDLG